MINEGCISTYIDDIMIYSMDLEEHRSTVKHVLALLQEHDLYLKPEKCEFEKEKGEYLGLVVSEGKVEMDPVKVEGVSREGDRIFPRAIYIFTPLSTHKA